MNPDLGTALGPVLEALRRVGVRHYVAHMRQGAEEIGVADLLARAVEQAARTAR